MTAETAQRWWISLRQELDEVEAGPEMQPCRYGTYPSPKHPDHCFCGGAGKMTKAALISDITCDMEFSYK